MELTRRYRRDHIKRLGILAVLLGAVALMASASVLNVTYWYINTTSKPPVSHHPGDDVKPNGTVPIVVRPRPDPTTGINVTEIYITGVAGDTINVTDIMRMCNRHQVDMRIRISDVKILRDYYPEKHISLLKIKFTQPVNQTDNFAMIKGDQVVDSTSGYVKLKPGECAKIGADLTINATAPHGKRLAEIQVNFEKVLG